MSALIVIDHRCSAFSTVHMCRVSHHHIVKYYILDIRYYYGTYSSYYIRLLSVYYIIISSYTPYTGFVLRIIVVLLYEDYIYIQFNCSQYYMYYIAIILHSIAVRSYDCASTVVKQLKIIITCSSKNINNIRYQYQILVKILLILIFSSDFLLAMTSL